MKLKRIDGSTYFDEVNTEKINVGGSLIYNSVYTAITGATTLLPSQLIGGVLDINCTTASFAITLPTMATLDLKKNDSFEFFAKCRTGVGMTVSFTGANVYHATTVDIPASTKACISYRAIVNNTGGSNTLDLYRVCNTTSAFG